jgi:hypothetical protein
MRDLKTPRAGAVFAAVAAAAGLAGAVAPAQAQTLIPGVTGCSAEGGKQMGGAVVGALAGGLLGNSISGHNRTTGTIVGAAAGAAAGSAVGCQMQKNDARRAAAADATGPATYRQGGYELSSDVAPANYERLGGIFVATQNVNIRATPSAGGARVGKLRRGERFEALAQVRGSDWMLVGRDGVGVGYVHAFYARPDAERYAARY